MAFELSIDAKYDGIGSKVDVESKIWETLVIKLLSESPSSIVWASFRLKILPIISNFLELLKLSKNSSPEATEDDTVIDSPSRIEHLRHQTTIGQRDLIANAILAGAG